VIRAGMGYCHTITPAPAIACLAHLDIDRLAMINKLRLIFVSHWVQNEKDADLMKEGESFQNLLAPLKRLGVKGEKVFWDFDDDVSVKGAVDTLSGAIAEYANKKLTGEI
jgi:hypothetical protein